MRMLTSDGTASRIGLGMLVLLVLTACSTMTAKTFKTDRVDQRLAHFPRGNLPLNAPARIYWDEHLIPFIEASTDEDCAFLIGLVQAHLRLGQMTLVNRISQGRLAESAGPFATRVDVSIRMMQLDRAVPAIERSLPDHTRLWLAHFVRGLNYYQDQVDEKPLEFGWLLNLQKEPWTVADILRIGRLMGADVNWFNFFGLLGLTQKPYWDDFWERFTALGSTSTASYAAQTDLLGTVFDLTAKSGSNAMVLSPGKTGERSAILATDPHLGLMIPNTWLIGGYACPSYRVVGLMFPGVPMVLVGRNENISWAGTNMRSASSELYRISEDAYRAAEAAVEKIRVRFWRDRAIVTRHTPHGAVISDAPLLNAAPGDRLALKWMGHAPSDEFTAFLKVNAAANWEEFIDAFGTYGVSGQNFLYADRQGNIGMLPAVMLPRRDPVHAFRPKHLITDPGEPIDWNRPLTVNELPKAFNPRQGYLLSANNNPVDSTPRVGYAFSSNARIDRLQHLMTHEQVVGIERVKEIQRDVVDMSSLALKDKMLSFLNANDLKENGRIAALVAQLSSWDGAYHAESRAPAAFQRLTYHFVLDYYTRTYDKDYAEKLLSYDQYPVVIRMDLERDDPDRIRNSLLPALAQVAKKFRGEDTWGDMHRMRLGHPLGNVPVIGRRYILADYPADGTYNTLMKTAHTVTNERHRAFYGANARLICRMAAPDDTYVVLLGGQDGDITSKFSVDQIDLWRAGQYIRLPLTPEGIAQRFRVVMDVNGR